MHSQPSSQHQQRLQDLSAVCTEEGIFHKLDIVAAIYVQDRHVLNVYRRYNSTFNIVFEDGHGGFHYQPNKSLMESMEELFDVELDAYPKIERLYSFIHQAYMPSIHHSSLWRMTWEYVATYYGCILLTLQEEISSDSLVYLDSIPPSPVPSPAPSSPASEEEAEDDHIVLRSGRRIVRLSQE